MAILAAASIAGSSLAASGGRPIRLVAFGDSLMAGYQLPDGDGFAPKLEAALKAQGRDVIVVNGGRVG